MAVSRINEAGLNVNQYGNRNVIINGAMQVAQRGTSSTGLGTASAYYTVDRFKISMGATTAGRFTMSQDSSAPSGFANSVKLECTTADTSIAAGEYLILQQSLEGQDVQRFAKGTSDAKEFTVSFYVKGNASATYVVALYDNDNNRYVAKTFSVTTDWTRIEITYPADTTGAFGDDNASSLELWIWLHAGSTFTSGTLPTTWASYLNANAAVGAGSLFDSTSRTFFMTGLQLEVGDTATPFEHRSYGDELQRCRRYCEIMTAVNSIYVNPAAGYNSLYRTMHTLLVEKRAAPTVTVYGTGGYPNNAGYMDVDGVGNDAITAEGRTNAIFIYGITSPHSGQCAYKADAEL